MLTVIIKDNSNYQQAAIQVTTAAELYDILSRNGLLICTEETMIKKNKSLCVAWFVNLSNGVAIVNPNYLKCSMRIAPEKTVLIHTEDNCASCGQPLPAK